MTRGGEKETEIGGWSRG